MLSREQNTQRRREPAFVRLISLVVWTVFLAIAANATSLFAQSGSQSGSQSGDAVESGREAFQRSARYPWYDREQDEFRRVDVPPPRDIAGQRKSRWELGESNRNWDFRLGSLRDASGVISVIMYVLLATLIIILLVVIIRIAGQSAPLPTITATNDVTFDSTRIGDLPFHFDGDTVDLLPMAERMRAKGNFGQAIVYLFSYQLLHLDHNRLIRLNKGKTNRQYVRELRPNRDLQQILEQTMVAFEDVFFGEHSLNGDRFEHCWNSLNSFHQLSNPGVAG